MDERWDDDRRIQGDPDPWTFSFGIMIVVGVVLWLVFRG